MSQEIINYYEGYDEDSRLTKDHAHRVERDTTLAALDAFISPGAHVLDVAAGTGAYAFHYAARGCAVHAIDIVPRHVEAMQRRVQLHSGADIEVSLGDARDLSSFQDESFDIVLCMGPIYHIGDDGVRRACLLSCIRLMQPQGILAVAYVNQSVMKLYPRSSFFHGATPEGMEKMASDCGLSTRDHLATDGVAPLMAAFLNDLPHEAYQEWLAFHLRTCHLPTSLRNTLHALMICGRSATAPPRICPSANARE